MIATRNSHSLAAGCLLMLVFACGTTTPLIEPDGSADGAVAVDSCRWPDAGATPHDGGGYCCPVNLGATHWCNGPAVGRWVLNPACCDSSGWEDQAYLPGVDGHGCPILVPDNDEHHCCNCLCAFHPESCSDYDASSVDASTDAPDAG